MNHTTLAWAAAFAWGLAAAPAQAHGPAAHAHSTPYVAAQVVQTAFGRQGDPAKVTRTFRIAMTDAMRFSPQTLSVRRGETVRLRIVNQGALQHELVLGTAEEIRKHWEAMKKHPEMEHEDPHMAHVAPGQRGEIVWQFTEAGEFEFACLLPGHFEAGMRGKVLVR